jgi:hypothetical protein
LFGPLKDLAPPPPPPVDIIAKADEFDPLLVEERLSQKEELEPPLPTTIG